MDGEFRVFLALLALIGWVTQEVSLIFTRMWASPLGRVGGILGLASIGWCVGGWIGFLVGVGFTLLWGFLRSQERLVEVVVFCLLFMGLYVLYEEKVWLSLRHMLWSWARWFRLSLDVVDVVVFFRPYYAGYLAACVVFGMYRGIGKYPLTLWYRLVKKPPIREGLLFVALSGAMLIGQRGWEWLTRIAVGPWTLLLVFFLWRGIMMILYSEIGRRLSLWMLLALFLLVLLWLGEAFLVGVWVFVGVGLMSDWFRQEKET